MSKAPDCHRGAPHVSKLWGGGGIWCRRPRIAIAGFHVCQNCGGEGVFGVGSPGLPSRGSMCVKIVGNDEDGSPQSSALPTSLLAKATRSLPPFLLK